MTAAVDAGRLPEPLDGAPADRVATVGLGLLKLGIFVSYLGLAILKPELPDNTAMVDIVIGVLCIAGLVSMWRRGSPASRAILRVLPWFWVFLIGSLVGLSHVGMTAWGLSSIARTTIALLAFFCVWHLLWVDDLVSAARKGVWVAAGLGMFALIGFGYSYRAFGWFPNPNVAGHFGASIGATIIMMSERWWAKALGLSIIVYTLHATGSFGAMAMCLTMAAVVLVRSMQRNTAVLTVVLVGIVIVTGLVITSPEEEVPTQKDPAGAEVSTAISQRRFERSQRGRLDIWGTALSAWMQEPMGIGPNGVKNRNVVVRRGIPIEVHSDPLGVLVDRGPLGLIGFIGMWAAIWSVTRKGGLARILIVGNWVQGLFRETINYRHLWLLLALLIVLDDRREREEIAAASDDPPDEPVPDASLPEVAGAH